MELLILQANSIGIQCAITEITLSPILEIKDRVPKSTMRLVLHLDHHLSTL